MAGSAKAWPPRPPRPVLLPPSERAAVPWLTACRRSARPVRRAPGARVARPGTQVGARCRRLAEV
eukprot:6020959-Lingulodinium_polyedra.AAC.1